MRGRKLFLQVLLIVCVIIWVTASIIMFAIEGESVIFFWIFLFSGMLAFILGCRLDSLKRKEKRNTVSVPNGVAKE